MGIKNEISDKGNNKLEKQNLQNVSQLYANK